MQLKPLGSSEDSGDGVEEGRESGEGVGVNVFVACGDGVWAVGVDVVLVAVTVNSFTIVPSMPALGSSGIVSEGDGVVDFVAVFVSEGRGVGEVVLVELDVAVGVSVFVGHGIKVLVGGCGTNVCAGVVGYLVGSTASGGYRDIVH